MSVSRIGVTVFLSLLAASRGWAAPLYSTTDLGTDPRVLSNASGQAYGVVNSDSGVVYEFAKLPITPINVHVDTPGIPGQPYIVLTMQSGTHQDGYRSVIDSSTGSQYFVPLHYEASAGWFNYSSPVSDINRNSQIVGTSLLPSGGSYAAFSDTTGNTHEGNIPAYIVDNLNNYFATIPGMTLTSAFKIDDVGRILAGGSDGHDYLLTPVSLGAPATVPEPSTAIVFGVIGSFLGLQTVRRRSRRVRNR